MRTILALFIVVYLIGVGVFLAPTIRGKWDTLTAGEMSSSVLQALPTAFAWPVAAYHRLSDEPATTPAKS